MNTYIFSIPTECGGWVSAEVLAPHRDAAFHNLQQGKFELLDLSNILLLDDAELVRAYDIEGEDV